MALIKLTGSVGIGGKNTEKDVKTIQISLNKILAQIPPTKKLSEDSRLGSRPEKSKTVDAIKLFQKEIVRMVRPDGKIDPNGKSHRKLNEQLKNLVPAVSVFAPLPVTLKAKLKKKLFQYEGKIPHMYLDTKGYVTVGIGHLLKDVAAAQKVPFLVRNTNTKATTKQIKDEFELLYSKQSLKGQYATNFKSLTKLIISEAVINGQVNKHIKIFESELKRIYGPTEFLSFPDNVKLALFDMIFNLGMSKLKNTFPSFNKHLKAGDYKKAATESSRQGISSQRNAYVHYLLSNA